MAQGQRSNNILLPQARQALERLKQEVASELGVPNYQGYLGDVPSRINGAVGGNMVRKMIAAAEQALVEQAAGQVQAGFRQALQTPVGGFQQHPQQFQQPLSSQPFPGQSTIQ